MADFSAAIVKLLAREGGEKVTNDPDDPGGLTKYGITQKSYPKINIRTLTEAQARQIFRADFWSKVHGDELASQALAEAVFDAAVNQGPGTAIRWLQEIAGVPQDGIIGPVSMAAVNALPEDAALAMLRVQRIASHLEQSGHPGKEKFLRGWIRRDLEA